MQLCKFGYKYLGISRLELVELSEAISLRLEEVLRSLAKDCGKITNSKHEEQNAVEAAGTKFGKASGGAVNYPIRGSRRTLLAG